MREWMSLLSDAMLTCAPAAVPLTGGPPGLEQLLQRADGVVSHGRAFRVFGAAAPPGVPSRDVWNQLLRQAAPIAAHNHRGVFFADDAFGGQYCWDGVAIHRIELDPFADVVLGDAFVDVADAFDWALLRSTSAAHGPIDAAEYAVPLVPVCVGGERTARNLQRMDAAAYVGWISDIWGQIRDLPAGAPLMFEFEP